MSAPIEEVAVEPQLEEEKQVLSEGDGDTAVKLGDGVPGEGEKQGTAQTSTTQTTAQQKKPRKGKDKPPVSFEKFADLVAVQEDETAAKVPRSKSIKAYRRLSGQSWFGDMWSRNKSHGEANGQKSSQPTEFVSTPEYKDLGVAAPDKTGSTRKEAPIGRALSLRLPSKVSGQATPNRPTKEAEDVEAPKPVKDTPAGKAKGLGRALSLRTFTRRGIEATKPAKPDQTTVGTAVPTIAEETAPSKEPQQNSKGLDRSKSLFRRHGAKSGPSSQPASAKAAEGTSEPKQTTDAQQKPSLKWKFWK